MQIKDILAQQDITTVILWAVIFALGFFVVSIFIMILLFGWVTNETVNRIQKIVIISLLVLTSVMSTGIGLVYFNNQSYADDYININDIIVRKIAAEATEISFTTTEEIIPYLKYINGNNEERIILPLYSKQTVEHLFIINDVNGGFVEVIVRNDKKGLENNIIPIH